MDEEEFVPQAAWLTRFGRRLMHLHPMMTAVTAARLSVDAHQRSFEAPPENAAGELAAGSHRVGGGRSPAGDAGRAFMNHVCAGKDGIEKIRSAKSRTAAFTALLDCQTLRGRDPVARAEALAAYDRTLARLEAR